MRLHPLVLPVIVLALLLGQEDRGRSAPQPETAEWVARQVEDRDVGRDGRFQVKMRLFDRHQRLRERELVILTLRHTAKRDRMLIRFTYPHDIKGTAFLVWENPAGEDERFLYLPALGRVRRIAGAEAQDSFVGSDFAYEDIGGREFDDYTYAMVEPNGVWNAPDGRSVAAYRIESRARDPQARDPRVVSTVRKDNFVVVHADIYNRRDERHKTYDVRRLERVQRIWTLSDVVMTSVLERTRTELLVTSAQYNIGLKETAFSRRELERGL